MRIERPSIATPGGPVTSFLAAPDDWSHGPAVVVIQEWWGFNEHIASVARRFADHGFAAVAPDLYPGRRTSEPDEAEKLMMAMDKAEAMAGLRSTIGWTVDQLGARRVGVVGFCMGGSLAWDVAMSDARIAAAVAFYGGADLGGVRVPVVPVQAHYAELDDFPQAMLDEARALLGADFHWYEGVDHGFMNDTRDAHAPEAAALAWERATTFLRRHVG
jgi:carboxymethylenebutenolidase